MVPDPLFWTTKRGSSCVLTCKTTKLDMIFTVFHLCFSQFAELRTHSSDKLLVMTPTELLAPVMALSSPTWPSLHRHLSIHPRCIIRQVFCWAFTTRHSQGMFLRAKNPHIQNSKISKKTKVRTSSKSKQTLTISIAINSILTEVPCAHVAQIYAVPKRVQGLLTNITIFAGW